ncbi:MAG TPA: LAGLIDADG family homing endonuclease [Candidatus Paceibacterota bacterium]|nr:LAGLIDADG family homing endonuclease [Candidatus Paceibacterota bacterium]
MAKVKGLRRVLTEEKLRELYMKRKLTMADIARQFGVTYQTIIYWLKKFDMGIRGPKTYNKNPFSGDILERNYLMGLSIGDFNVKKHHAQILVRTSTTHPAMINLFKQLFEKYSFVGQVKLKSTPSWYIYTILSNSFNFLLNKDISIKTFNEEEFYAFLSGYVDAEGCLCITNNKETFRYHFSLASEDINILKGIKKYLSKLKYKVFFRISAKKGNLTTNGKIYNKDYWELRLYSKKEVLNLIEKLQLQHYEKIRWKELMFELNNYRKWVDVKERVFRLRKDIDNEVEKCMS